jgi:dolichyl-diphosphooligosaccharide--protein glycosyltransferase
MPTTSAKIKQFFQEGWEKSRASMKIVPANIILVISLVLIFICGVFIRLSPVFNGVYLIKEFDPWAQYKTALYIVDNGFPALWNWTDFQSWYPEGNQFYRMYVGLPLTSAIFYWILNGLGFPVSLYDVCFIFPAFMGGVTCIVAFFLGKEVLDKKTGLLAAFFLAFSPGYMQRTVAGFFDNETIGVFATLMTFLFFLRSLKRGSVIDGIIGGLSFGYLSISWGGFTYTAMLLPLCAVIMVIVKKYSTRLLIAYTSVLGIGLIIKSFIRRDPITVLFNSSDFLIPIIVLLALPFVELIYRKKESDHEWYRKFWVFIKKAALPGILIGAVGLWVLSNYVPLLALQSRLLSVINPLLRESISLVASVGEHMPSPWATFYYNTFIPLLFIVPGIYFAYKRGNDSDIITIIITITLYYFTGSMTRIIMLFAPIAAIMGAYGISQILKSFGALTSNRKVAPASRLRKREARQGMDPSVSYVIFAFVGLLAIAQVSQATDVAVKQLPYTELIVGGQFHDWEESLTWMRTNLNGGTIVASWWDYGYWSTILGNVTSVNDNATINSTRIGFVGMGMMMNDELEAARVFKRMGAEYVLVYFGHMVSGLGGDEGKWPWMVKICNDYSNVYKNYPGLHQAETWAKFNDSNQFQVFNYGDYINESSGQYEDRWFQSQLVRMMFYEEPLTTDKATTQLQYWAAREISGDGTQSYQPRKDDNGKLWSAWFSDPEYFNFKVFRKAFFSSNSSVKIYKIDYTAIESDFKIVNTTLYANKFGSVVVNNTGSKPLNITSGRFAFAGTEFDVFPFEGTAEVQPGEEKSFWFNTKSKGITEFSYFENDTVDLYFNASVNTVDKTYTFERNAKIIVKPAMTNTSFHVDRATSSGKVPNVVEFEARNTGLEAITIANVTVNNELYTRANITAVNETYVIPVNETRRFQVNTGTNNFTVGDIALVNATMVGGISDLFTVTFCKGDAAMTFTHDFITLPESDLIVNNTFLQRYGLLNNSVPELTRYRSFLPVNFGTSVAWTNGTIMLQVKNTGNEALRLDEVWINGSTYNGWVVQGGLGYSFNPGESRTIKITHGALALDAIQEISIFAINSSNDVVASDGALIKTLGIGEKIQILANNQYTFALTNETVYVTVKNVGSVATTITRLWINSSTQITLNNNNVELGNRALGLQETVVLKYNYTALGKFYFNATDDAFLRVGSAFVNDSKVVSVTENPMTALDIVIEYAKAQSTGAVKVIFKNSGVAGLHLNLTIYKVKIVANGVTNWIIPDNMNETVTLGTETTLNQDDDVYLKWPGIALVVGDKVTVTIYSYEGGEATASKYVVAA